MALFRGIQEYIALDANNITLVFDSGTIVYISGNIFLYPPQGHPILYNCPDVAGLTYEEILGQCFILMAAGFDTTSNTLSFLLYNLAVSPKCQDKLYEEISKLGTDPVGAAVYPS